MFSRSYLVYVIQNKTNWKVYVGQTVDGPGYGITFRWKEHIAQKTTEIDKAIRKEGHENFEYYLLETGLTKREALDLERFYIDSLASNDPRFGYNSPRALKPRPPVQMQYPNENIAQDLHQINSL